MKLATILRGVPQSSDAPASVHADALAAHDAKAAAKRAELQALAATDAAKLADVSMLRGIQDGLRGARDRRLDLLAQQGLGADVAAALATVESAIRAGEKDEALHAERADIAVRQRALLAPQLDNLRREITALDAARPDLERAAEIEAAIALLPAYRKAQQEFMALWLEVHARCLRADAARIVNKPTGAAVAVRDLTLPVPFLPDFESVVLNRDALYAEMKARAAVPAKDLQR